jgi:chromosome segregation protein
MYLQKLEIQGFKSFGKRAVLEFPAKSFTIDAGNSITAVVGPNGSGKSNVVDAIRWVLGEQSMKLLRGKKSEDIIFSGSPSKARLGAAEVSLYLNNEDGLLDIGMSEIVITRKVFRDGESEYFINKKRVRLFDVLMLIAKANFGQKSFSIIGQGMVDHIVNMSIFERKEFFDEATGVKQFQIKRDQANSRLKSSQNNLEKVNGILAELEPRLKLLQKQMKRLERRAKVEEELRGLQKKYYGHLFGELESKKAELGSAVGTKAELLADLETRMRETRQHLEDVSRGESRKDIFNNLQKEYNRLIAEKNELLQEQAMIDGKMNIEYIKRGKENLAWLEQKRGDLDKRTAVIRESLDSLATKIQAEGDLLADKNARLEKVKGELAVLENNLASLRTQADSIERGKSWEADRVSQAVLRQRNYIKGIEGTVSELFFIKDEYQKAAFVAAKGVLNAIVVKDDETAVRCINYLKENRLGTALFIPLDRVAAKLKYEKATEILKEVGAIAFLSDLVECERKYKELFEYLFGMVVVFDTLDNARRIDTRLGKLVTLDGDIIDKRGFFHGGFLQKVQMFGDGRAKALDLEQRLREIAVLNSRIEDLRREKEELFLEINERRINFEVLKTKEKGLKNDSMEMDRERQRILRELEENKLAPEDKDVYFKNLGSRKCEVEAQLKKVDDKIGEKRAKIDAFNIEEEKKTKDIFESQRHLQGLQEQANKIGAELNLLRVDMGKLETREDALKIEARQELGDLPLERGGSDGNINVDAWWHEIGKLKHDLEMIGGIDQETVEEFSEVKERYDFLSGQVIDLDAAIVDLDKVRKELDEIIQKQFGESFAKINKEFGHYFGKIFQGGKAKLILFEDKAKVENGDAAASVEIDATNEQPERDVAALKIGIDIAVSLPNKKIENIAVLSGGEKTMASIALICAIVASNPSPFVVFDEIDAALDEANSERLAEIVQELSKKTQFVLITHNRVIMHVADVLYGVTMTGDGISRLLSLSFSEAEKQVEND